MHVSRLKRLRDGQTVDLLIAHHGEHHRVQATLAQDVLVLDTYVTHQEIPAAALVNDNDLVTVVHEMLDAAAYV